MSVRCLSSQCMERVLAWRNAQGSEENWNDETLARDIANDQHWLGRRVVAGVANWFLMKTSTVETVAYAALAVLSLIIYPCTTTPYTFFAKCLDSSIFTILWSIQNIFCNTVFPRVVTKESFFRMFYDDFEGMLLESFAPRCFAPMLRVMGSALVAISIPKTFGLLSVILFIGMERLNQLRGFLGWGPQWTREEDLEHTRLWLEQHRPGVAFENFQRESINIRGIVDLSTRLRVAEINANADRITTEAEDLIVETVQGGNEGKTVQGENERGLLEAFESMSSEIIELITVKAIFTYILGKYKNAQIPQFFQEKTQEAIATLRKNLSKTSENAIKDMEKLLSSLDGYGSLDGLDGERLSSRNIIIQLKGVASEEMQGNSVFIKKCLPNAYEKVFSNAN